jgi:hypothetical protein
MPPSPPSARSARISSSASSASASRATATAKHELEVKEFNILLGAAAAERKQQPIVLDSKGYDEYKAAFDRFLRNNERMLTPDEVKTLSVGSDPDGGYLVTPDTTGRMVKKVYETSPIRQIASVQPISTDALEGMEDLGEGGVGYAGEHTQGLGHHHCPARQMADRRVHPRQRAEGDAAAARRCGRRCRRLALGQDRRQVRPVRE